MAPANARRIARAAIGLGLIGCGGLDYEHRIHIGPPCPEEQVIQHAQTYRLPTGAVLTCDTVRRIIAAGRPDAVYLVCAILPPPDHPRERRG